MGRSSADAPVKEITASQRKELIDVLKARFDKNMGRHEDINWPDLLTKLESSSEKLCSLFEMERTGGEPDVIGYSKTEDEYIFCDCSPESPSGRRNLCYDRKALESRKEFKPVDNAMDVASAMGISILTEDQYISLQRLGNFDQKTSSWLTTPSGIRDLGGAIFGDRRYNHVFIYHNGASSYYSGRGFRGILRL